MGWATTNMTIVTLGMSDPNTHHWEAFQSDSPGVAISLDLFGNLINGVGLLGIGTLEPTWVPNSLEQMLHVQCIYTFLHVST